MFSHRRGVPHGSEHALYPDRVQWCVLGEEEPAILRCAHKVYDYVSAHSGGLVVVQAFGDPSMPVHGSLLPVDEFAIEATSSVSGSGHLSRRIITFILLPLGLTSTQLEVYQRLRLDGLGRSEAFEAAQTVIPS